MAPDGTNMTAVAVRELPAEPPQSSHTELRFGRRGSLSIRNLLRGLTFGAVR